MADLRYPIGKFSFEGNPSYPQIQKLIDNIEQAPAQLRTAVQDLSDSQLDTPYRPNGWTVRQLVHHVPDSHANAYVRFKLALTEDEPTIRPYFEDRWAELADAKSAPIELSLALLDALHKRWVIGLRNLKGQDFKRTFRHPDLGIVSLEKNVALYSWHGQHHVAHVTELRKRMNWQIP
jgi:uncharacterized damage-inducible protein DinB